MKTEQPILITSVTASGADLSRLLFVGFDGALCAAGVKALGVCNADTAVGLEAPVTAIGIALVTAGAAVAAGAEVESNAAGKAITLAAGVSNGYALDAAAADGDVIRVLV